MKDRAIFILEKVEAIRLLEHLITGQLYIKDRGRHLQWQYSDTARLSERFRIWNAGANIYIDNISTQLDSQSTLFRDICFPLSKTGGNIPIGRQSTQLDSQTTYFVTYFSVYQKQGQAFTLVVSWHSSTLRVPISWHFILYIKDMGKHSHWQTFDSSRLSAPISWHSLLYIKKRANHFYWWTKGTTRIS